MTGTKRVTRVREAVASVQFDPADGKVQRVKVRFPWTSSNGETIWVTTDACTTDLIAYGVHDDLRRNLIEDNHTDRKGNK
jgi:hypothetical protein